MSKSKEIGYCGCSFCEYNKANGRKYNLHMKVLKWKIKHLWFVKNVVMKWHNTKRLIPIKDCACAVMR